MTISSILYIIYIKIILEIERNLNIMYVNYTNDRKALGFSCKKDDEAAQVADAAFQILLAVVGLKILSDCYRPSYPYQLVLENESLFNAIYKSIIGNYY